MYLKIVRNRYIQVLLLAGFIVSMIYMLETTSYQVVPPCQLQKEIRLTLDRSDDAINGTRQNTSDPRLYLTNLFEKIFLLPGHRYNNTGIQENYEHVITSSIIHSFSPYTENRFREIMLEPRHEQRIYANR